MTSFSLNCFLRTLRTVLLGVRSSTYELVGKLMRTKSFQSCPTLCNPMDRSTPGFSVRGIVQARILEWAAMPSSRGSSQPRNSPDKKELLRVRAENAVEEIPRGGMRQWSKNPKAEP